MQLGDQFEITLDALRNRGGPESGCQYWECPLDFPTIASPSEESVSLPFTGYICESRHAKIKLDGECEVLRYVSLSLYPPLGTLELRRQTDDGTPAAVTLIRGLSWAPRLQCSGLEQRFPGSSPNQTMRCIDVWNVTLTPLAAK